MSRHRRGVIRARKAGARLDWATPVCPTCAALPREHTTPGQCPRCEHCGYFKAVHTAEGKCLPGAW